MVRSMLAQGLLYRRDLEPFALLYPITRAAVLGLATLGTPHIGAPTLPGLDWLGKCQLQLQEMQGYMFNGKTISDVLIDSKTVNGSLFLTPLLQAWAPSHVNLKLFAAAGRACNNPFRAMNQPGVFVNSENGCLITGNSFSDGAVCDQSARVDFPGVGALTPTNRTLMPDGSTAQGYVDLANLYQHAVNIAIPGSSGDAFAILMCGNNSLNSVIIDPPVDNNPGSLFNQLKDFLNGLYQ